VHQAVLVQHLLELTLLVPRHLATRVPLYSHDFMVRLVFSRGSRVVLLAFVGAVAVIALVVVLGEVLVLLVLLVGPSLHHIPELQDSLGVVLTLKFGKLTLERKESTDVVRIRKSLN
jgi:hypothetical protein